VAQLALLVDSVVTQLFSLDKAKLTIGRSSNILVEDLQSRNGTLVNDQPIHRCQLRPDDIITIGFNRFKLLDDRAAGRESTVLMMME
jgi:pSer/pThr/pTyr-binding forkhead associated (FHA) protein